MSNQKPTNPKDAVGIAKVPFSTIPSPVLAEVGLAMMEGALKYGRHNFRSAGVRASVYYDAFLRHMVAFWEGEDIDPESGICHLSKAIAGLAVLRDSMMRDNWVDDRPPKYEDGWMDDLNAKAKALLDKYPPEVRKEAFIQLDEAVEDDSNISIDEPEPLNHDDEPLDETHRPLREMGDD